MKVVLDTNVMLLIVSKRSPFRWIFDLFLAERFTLCVTTDILDEYAEIIGDHMGAQVVEDLMNTLEESENVEYVTRYFRWNLISTDPDDNKFVDCAISCNAQYIVTEDKHFQIIKQMPYLNLNIVGIEEFRKIFI